jgi:DNA invertase Pin-like site-specific DNA recombinase
MTGHTKNIRCAVYTRKSSEEGLDQLFNSLDAQREACQAYILSQRHEGWRTIHTHYDDGGFSGGSIERPALQQLLADIRARKIDTVVVYKVDRLTRSLTDFAKIIEIFDANDVSFVSVTQQFNTTSSMGRLTLNVLLSFAQFEREVTGERIRDKIVLSKRKGMWMGGVVPLGYDLDDHHLLVNPEGAKRVRQIFKKYLELGSVKQLKAYLDRRGIRAKARTSRAGRKSGGAAFSRGALYHLLQNRIYIGEVPHRDQSYPGVHEAIVPRELWESVQTKLKENACARRDGRDAAAVSILKGLLFDAEGNRYTPSHAVKKGKRYRYYTSQRVIQDSSDVSTIPGRFPASEIEVLVVRKLIALLGSSDFLIEELGTDGDERGTKQRLIQAASQFAKQINKVSGVELYRAITRMISKIVIDGSSVQLRVRKQRLRLHLLGMDPGTPVDDNDLFIVSIPANLQQCRGEKRIVLPATETELLRRAPILPLVKAISRAHEWAHLLITGECTTLQDIATRTGLDPCYVSRILPGAFLAPNIVGAILRGEQPPQMNLDKLLDAAALTWEQQAQLAVQHQ